jgi:hypothetical protein
MRLRWGKYVKALRLVVLLTEVGRTEAMSKDHLAERFYVLFDDLFQYEHRSVVS